MTFMQKLRKSAKEKKGFTLIELIIVIAIIAILIALIAPNLVKFLSTAKNTSVEANAKTAYTSIQTYLTEKETAGTPVTANTYIITSDGTNLKVEINAAGGTENAAMAADLKSYFNPKELKSVTITAKVAASSALEDVKWDSNGQIGNYPKN
ncbi:prepilin-type N-terminal cleavage/methylation domain-containing protein [Robinsoniella peoriensis]|uniref:Pilin n=1 Tax=Robinsoniella peoriensis TaxID=180332 RepID=A0A4U8PZL6_9FIRM|nr:prepilin-type N-terminal cleavage/methylation domain-containing protein [Robinsoniella peoriensis]MDU7027355.1 prepilin-type N-terminal cleavage/methylation domain-containing protein [Clostridiales bacterium]TLC97696.1 Pilin [Robinsoniella peoriensis]